MKRSGDMRSGTSPARALSFRFRGAGGAASQGADGGERDRAAGVSDQRIHHGGGGPVGNQRSGTARGRPVRPADARGPSDGRGARADRGSVRPPRGSNGSGGRRVERARAG